MKEEMKNVEARNLFGEDMRPSFKVLHLTLHKKWFDKILSGKKTHEFRLVKPYWRKRLENRNYDFIEFRNGYGRQAPTMRIVFGGVQKRTFRQIDIYCISLGKIIETKNLKD